MTLWSGDRPPILASSSRSRQTLLHHAGIPFEVIPADIDERAVENGAAVSAPGDVAALLAREKALAVAGHHRGRIVIGADQTLALGSRRFSKPKNRDQAAEQLAALAGAVHELHSAVALAVNDEVRFCHVSVARLAMRPLSAAAIDAYLDAAGDVVCTSVGAYQLEGLGVHLFERVDGDHFTVLGLPLLPLFAYLRGVGLLTF